MMNTVMIFLQEFYDGTNAILFLFVPVDKLLRLVVQFPGLSADRLTTDNPNDLTRQNSTHCRVWLMLIDPHLSSTREV
jgi:hypothetical protein